MKSDSVVKGLVIGGCCLVAYYMFTKYTSSSSTVGTAGSTVAYGGSTSIGAAGAASNSGQLNGSGVYQYAPVVTNAGQSVNNTAVYVGAAATVAGSLIDSLFGGDDE